MAQDDLIRRLGVLDIFCIAVGTMMSSGIFILPGLAYAKAGPAVVVSYLLAGCLMTSAALSAIELATAMPKAGGDYFFIARAMGPAVGTVLGLLSWFALTLKSAFALVGVWAFTEKFFPFDTRLLVVGVAVLFTVINLLGAKKSSLVQALFVLVLLGLMSLYVFKGLPQVHVANYIPFVPHGWHAVLSTAGFVFVSYGGLLKISALAEEVKNPSRTIPLGVLSAVSVTMLIYALMVLVTCGILPPDALAHSLTPIIDAARVFMGQAGEAALSLAAMVAFLTTANGGILSASRYLLSLSRDELLPTLFGRVSSSRGTPVPAVLITGAFLIGLFFVPLESLVKMASMVVLLTQALANACVVILRESRLHNYQPTFRAPWYPWLQIASLAGVFLLLAEIGLQTLLIGLIFVAAGLIFFWFYGRLKQQREYALLHVLERLSARKVVRSALESELKDIIRERDELCLDRFDHVVEAADVVEISEPSDMEGLLQHLNPVLLARGLERPLSVQDLNGGEAVVRSVEIFPGILVAQAHATRPDLFDVVLVRSRQGIRFPEAEAPVHAMFFFLVGADEQDFHLKAVAALAQVVQDPQFDTRWHQARNAQALKDIIVLTDRRRVCSREPRPW
ncbi:amino acid permease [Desulfosoma caldarium]|uniref:Amino acid transporter n=1 Tax=Desulfosoma caldarium TaxID=610254 RepID=A0A3N1VK69_9BACT|nr:amino acid permease [Desulfosoma caldarium]ROR03204.1 amino acid transporter [Desulfosoma caldarium]